MKLATYRDGSRDGQLVVVSRDLSTAHYASGIAGRLQQVLDDWNFLSPQLEDLYQTLNHGKARHAFAFRPALCHAPLPRACQRLAGSAYPSHVERVWRARGAEVPDGLHREPMLRQGGSDDLLGAHEPIVAVREEMGIDVEAGIAVVTGDIALGAAPARALEGIRLVMLASEVALRHLVPAEAAQGSGEVIAWPATAFAPVAVTPDELGAAWRGGRVHVEVDLACNGRRIGRVDAGAQMQFHFGELIAHVARTRRLRAGSIVGGGAASQADPARGAVCLAEQRALEIAAHGEPRSGWLRFGDTVRIEAHDADGQSVFGAIEQVVTPAGGAGHET